MQAKRIVAADLPLSTKPDSKNKRYRIADSYLRFWLAFLERGIPLIERGRGTEAVGGWWNRQNNPEIDLIGADREPVAGAVHFVGSIKWLEDRPFDRHDYDALVRSVLAIPGTQFDTPLVAVSRSGVDGDLPVATCWGPEDLLRAWQ